LAVPPYLWSYWLFPEAPRSGARLSFFDDTDEPDTEIRTPSRPRDTSRRRVSGGGGGGTGGSGGSGSGGSGRRSGGRGGTAAQRAQEIRMRRIIAGVVIVIVIVLILIGVSSCSSSANKSAVESYTSNVNSLIKRSQNDSSQLFRLLNSGVSSSNATNVQNQINKIAQDASDVVSSAQKLSVPSSAKAAQAHLVQALQLREDGISSIARNIQPAAGSAVTQSATSTIAGDMARFYASDVFYKLYAVPEIASALHGVDASVGGADGVQISGAQFLPSLNWLNSNYIATTLGTGGGSSGTGGSSASGPGPHGSELNSVSYNGNTLQTSGNTITAKPPPTFTLTFTDSGASTERNVVCKVSIGGATGQKVVASVSPGQQTTCAVTLTGAPTAGSGTLKATIGKVPGEKNLGNNTLSFPVTVTG
jgi:hypothetical protein